MPIAAGAPTASHSKKLSSIRSAYLMESLRLGSGEGFPITGYLVAVGTAISRLLRHPSSGIHRQLCARHRDRALWPDLYRATAPLSHQSLSWINSSFELRGAQFAIQDEIDDSLTSRRTGQPRTSTDLISPDAMSRLSVRFDTPSEYSASPRLNAFFGIGGAGAAV